MKSMDSFMDHIKYKSKGKEELSESLQYFMIACGMQVSNLCKNMLEVMNDEGLMERFNWGLAQVLGSL